MSWISKETVAFLAALQADNTRETFQSMKTEYERDFKGPAAAFSAAVSDGLAAWLGMPVSGKVFRLNRDLRFSKDKTPYNTHLHIGFSTDGGGADLPMWMFGLEPGRLAVGMGVFEYSGAALTRWRERVAGPEGDALAADLAKLKAKGVRLNEPVLKKVPAPYPQDAPHPDLLRRKGLNVWKDFTDPSLAFGAGGVTWCLKEFRAFRSVHDWLAA